MKFILAFLTITIFSLLNNIAQEKYEGKPYNNQPQLVPGKIQCEFYDLGGESIAYHDLDSVNGGSGKLNPADGSYLNEFRMKEAVGISYTKTNDVDNNPYNLFNPEMDQLYVGWTKPGEWIKFTVDIRKSGTYIIGIMYTANGKGSISISVDGVLSKNSFSIPSTNQKDEPVAWRQWHHWNKIDSIGEIFLPEGLHTLQLTTLTNGNMNYDFLEMKLKNKD